MRAAMRDLWSDHGRRVPCLRIAIRECWLSVRKRLQFGLDRAARTSVQREAKAQIPDLELRAVEPTEETVRSHSSTGHCLRCLSAAAPASAIVFDVASC